VGTSNGEDIFAPRFMWNLLGGAPACGKGQDHRLAQFLTESMKQHPAGDLFEQFPAGGIIGLENAVESVENSKTWLENVGVPGLGGVKMRPDAGGRPVVMFYVVGGLCAIFYLLGACYFAFFAEAGRRAVAVIKEEYYGAPDEGGDSGFSDGVHGSENNHVAAQHQEVLLQGEVRSSLGTQHVEANHLETESYRHGQTINTPSFTADNQHSRQTRSA